jgi:hypothetical protein
VVAAVKPARPPRPLKPPTYLLGGDPPAWPPPAPYWLTRDGDVEDGEPMDVEVWTSIPVRLTNLGVAGAYWMSKAEWDISSRWGRYSWQSIARWVGVVPDDDRMIIRVD